MKIQCGNCDLEEVGRYKKLVEKGWKVFFLFDKQKVIRCKVCKPTRLDKTKMKFVEGYHSEMYYGIREQITKMKILKGLKTEEKLWEESSERRRGKMKKYHYERNIRKKKGSNKYG